MADLIEDWLNSEVKLSKTITNIEEDFSNGYLFGELLNKFNQITNLNEYKNKEDGSIKVTNFKLLEKAFRDMDIKIEKGRIFDLINKKRGVATRFLYLIKKTLAEKFINLENLDLKKCKFLLLFLTNFIFCFLLFVNNFNLKKKEEEINFFNLKKIKIKTKYFLSRIDPRNIQ